MKLNVFDYLVVTLKAAVVGVRRSFERHGGFFGKMTVAGVMPIVRGRLKLKEPIGPDPAPKETWPREYEARLTYDKDGVLLRVEDDKGKDITACLSERDSHPKWAGMTITAKVIETREEMRFVLPDPEKSIGTALALPVPVAAIRPVKFKDRPLTAKDLEAAEVVLQKKKDGVGCEIWIGKDGKLVKAVSARGGEVDLRNGIPELRDHVFHESVRDSKLWVEIRHPLGIHATTGLLHAGKDNAEAFVKKNGHPEVNVLGVLRNGGQDTSKLKYAEMRSLCELVSKKIPHGTVPEQCIGTVAEKQGFRDRVFKENTAADRPECDGVVAYRLDIPLKEQVLLRDKPGRSWDVVLMGFEPSKKISGAAGAFTYGDGKQVLGEVNIADPQMRVAVFQNPNRYAGKVARVSGLRRSSNGKIFQPVLKEISWEKNPASVAPWDAEADLRKQVDAMEPDPQKRAALIHRLKQAGMKKIA